MTEQSYYFAMPYEEAKRFSRFEANEDTLKRIRRYLGYSLDLVMTDCERQACEAIIDTALQRAAAGIAEFDCYKREAPVVIEDWEATL